MALTTEYIKKYVDNTLGEQEETLFYNSLVSIANLVIYRHFNNLRQEECNDARSEAIFGALKALEKPFVDFKNNDAMHYVYTNMRHSIHNYFRKYKDREISFSPELFDYADTHLKSSFKFEAVLSQLIYLYDIEYKTICSKFPCFEDFMVSFEEALVRMDIVDSVLFFLAFEQLRKEPDVNATTIRDLLEQHRD